MTQPPSIGIRHIALKLNNMAAMRTFYTGILGFQVEWEPDPQNVYLTSGSDNLALHEVETELKEGSLDHLGIIVRHPEDVDAWAAFLRSHGVALKQEPKTHRDGARSIYLADPEKNVIQIIYHPPISGS